MMSLLSRSNNELFLVFHQVCPCMTAHSSTNQPQYLSMLTMALRSLALSKWSAELEELSWALKIVFLCKNLARIMSLGLISWSDSAFFHTVGLGHKQCLQGYTIILAFFRVLSTLALSMFLDYRFLPVQWIDLWFFMYVFPPCKEMVRHWFSRFERVAFGLP